MLQIYCSFLNGNISSTPQRFELHQVRGFKANQYSKFCNQLQAVGSKQGIALLGDNLHTLPSQDGKRSVEMYAYITTNIKRNGEGIS